MILDSSMMLSAAFAYPFPVREVRQANINIRDPSFPDLSFSSILFLFHFMLYIRAKNAEYKTW